MKLESLKTQRGWRRLVAALLALLLLWALAWAALPPVLRHLIESRGSEALGRRLSVGEIDFRPWSLELSLRDLVLYTRDGQAEQLALGRLYIDAELQSLWRGGPVLDALRIEQPRLRLTHSAPGHYDIDDLIALATQPSQPEAAPLRFALHNLELTGGRLEFHDEVAGQVHQLDDLQLGLPFLSNFDSGREVLVQPHLAFQLNGAPFEWSGQSTPFASTRHTELQARVDGLDLKPYLAYWPQSLPVHPVSGRLEADLRLVFEQGSHARLALSGTVGARQIRLDDAAGKPWLAFDRLDLDLAELQPLKRTVHLSAVHWQGPVLALRRDAQGRWLPDWGRAADAPGRAGATAPGPKPQADAAAPGWTARVDALELSGARLDWRDDSVSPAAELRATELALKLEDLRWPMDRPARWRGSLALSGGSDLSGGKASAPGRLHFDGQGTDQAAALSLRGDELPLALASPYLARFLKPELQGRLSLVAGLGWRAPELVLNLPTLRVDELKLRQGSQELVAWDRLRLSDARIDLAGRTVALGALELDGPRLGVARDAQGRFMYEDWLRPTAAPASPEATSGPATPSAAGAVGSPVAAPAWQWRLGRLAVAGGRVGWRDTRAAAAPPSAGRSPAAPGVALDVSDLQLQAGPLSQGPGGWGTEAVEWHLAASLAAGPSADGARAESGRLDYRGRLRASPWSTEGQLELVRLPLHALEPYFGDVLNIDLLRADASFRGRIELALAPAGLKLRVQGDGALEDVRANSVLAQVGVEAGPPISDELLSWKALSLRGIDLALRPDAPLALAIGETALSDFFARVVVNDQGHINLQSLVRAPAAPAGAVPATAAPTGSRIAAGGAPAPAAVPAASAATRPRIRIGPLSLVNGRVLFSDRFIKPNYSARLSELTGRLGAFSTETEDAALASGGLAELELRGRAEDTAALEVSGRLNPLASPPVLDIQGKVRGIELPPLSPYSIKYAGYGIERGKLSVDVAYRIDRDGHLNASNNIVLNQLSFGERVEGAPASLPVKLAVALLADRDGVIDINLPISGSLNDPEFRLAPIIGRLILNLVAKAITSPFSLLGSAFSASHGESNRIVFAPGAADLSAESQQVLDQVAKALRDRPALKLTVVGQVDLQAEREGLRQQHLAQMLLAEKRRQAVLAGHDGHAVEPVTAAETPALLKAVYQRADLPKPRNLLGLAKDLPGPEMEALLLASVPVSDELMQALAVQRGVVVRDYLARQQLPVERLFLGAIKTVHAEAGFQPSALLSLDTR